MEIQKGNSPKFSQHQPDYKIAKSTKKAHKKITENYRFHTQKINQIWLIIKITSCNSQIDSKILFQQIKMRKKYEKME